MIRDCFDANYNNNLVIFAILNKNQSDAVQISIIVNVVSACSVV